jgi:hypothetical protein
MSSFAVTERREFSRLGARGIAVAEAAMASAAYGLAGFNLRVARQTLTAAPTVVWPRGSVEPVALAAAR